MTLTKLKRITIHYHIDDYSAPWSDCTPVLLIHSAGGNVNRWHQWVPNLAKHRPVIRYDMRGHGLTETGTTITSVEELIQDILDLMEFLKIQKFHVVGASAGGVIALKLAHTSSMVKSLTLIASTPFLAQTNINASEWGRILKEEGTKAWLLSDSHLRFGRDTNPEIIKWYAEEGSKTPATTVISLQQCLLAQNYSPILKDIKIPSLILASENDDITPHFAQITLNEQLSNSKLMWFKDVGHNLKLEIPDELSHITSDFISNI